VEDQRSSAPSFGDTPVWLKVLLVGTGVLVCALGIYRHGVRSWDWLWSIGFLWIIFPQNMKGPLDKNTSWPLRVLILLWTAVCSAWFVHFLGWLPAVAFAVLAMVSPKPEEWSGFKTFAVKPKNIIVILAVLTLVIWFARETGAWVPTFCIVIAFALMEHSPNTRRPLRDNLRRPSVMAVACVAVVAAVWAWSHPSFGSIAGLVAVAVLVSSDIYLHTGEQSLAHH
jgi:hypothetical protein